MKFPALEDVTAAFQGDPLKRKREHFNNLFSIRVRDLHFKTIYGEQNPISSLTLA
jgi:hypothetical protein